MIYVIVALLAVLLPDFYIWASFVRGNLLIWNVLYWIPSLVLIASMIFGLTGHAQHILMNVFFVLLLSVVLPKLLFALVSVIGRGFGLMLPYAALTGNIIGGIVAIVILGGAIYGMTFGWRHVVVRNLEVASADLPAAFDGYKIVQLSDFHIGTYETAPATVDEIVEKANALQADVIVFTGDLVNSSPEELDLFMTVLPKLQARDGVYSVLGNHDYCEYRHYDTPDGLAKNVAELKRREAEIGWRLLLNEHQILRRGSDSIALVGVENDGLPPFPSKGDLRKALTGVPPTLYKVLLSHDPTHWRREVLPKTDIQLTLSGHTHAMQLKIGNFSPSQWTYKEWGGLYREQDRALHVSTGTGGNVGFRFGAWPEIDVITLRAKK